MTRKDAIKLLNTLVVFKRVDAPQEEIFECIKIAIKALEQEPKTEWIPVKDNMPVIGEEVLVCDLDGDMYITYLHTDGRWGFDYDGNKIKNVIAWMPLPKLLESEE